MQEVYLGSDFRKCRQKREEGAQGREGNGHREGRGMGTGCVPEQVAALSGGGLVTKSCRLLRPHKL